MSDYRNVANFDLEMGSVVDSFDGSTAKTFTSTSPYKSITISNDGTASVVLTVTATGYPIAKTITIKAGETFTEAFRGGATVFAIANASLVPIRVLVRQ